MKRQASLFFATLLVAISFISCGTKGGKEEPLPSKGAKVDIEHKYEITSSAPIEITFVAATVLDDVYFNGLNEKTPLLSKAVKHQGEQEYVVKTTSQALNSSLVISLDGKEDVEVSYVWIALINGKQVKTDKQTLNVNGVTQTKQYFTVNQ